MPLNFQNTFETLGAAYNADVNLTTDAGSYGNVRILSLKATRRQALNHLPSLAWEIQAELVSTTS